MAQTGYSKVQIYSSSTATHTPSAGNLTNDTNGSELAINITDGKLFYKDNSGTVQVLATKATALSTVTNNGVVYVNSSGQATSGSALVFDGTNLGLGVTPSAWQSYLALQMNAGSILSYSTNDYRMVQNTLRTGGAWQYINNGFANAYLQNGSAGGHSWYIAPSGTAGNAITFTQAMTLDASGRLLVGQSTVSNSVNGLYFDPAGGGNANIVHASGTASGTGYAFFLYAGSSIGSITQSGTTNVLYNIASDRRLKTNIVDFTDSGKYIDAFKPRSFTWITDNSQDIGFITDEYQETLPSAISGQPNATKEEEYEVTPAVKDEQGNITTPAVMGTRTVPVYQQGDFSTSAKMAIIIAELKSIRERLKTANIA